MDSKNKPKTTSITLKLTRAFFGGFALALLCFCILYFLLNALLNDYFLYSSYIAEASERYTQNLQQYVDENTVSATDSQLLHNWATEMGITIFSVSRDRVLIYDNTYTGNVPLIETDSQQLHYVWQYFHTVHFADGDASVYIYKNFKHNFYLAADLAAAVLSAFVWIGFFVYTVHKEANYIILLKQEVMAMREGSLQNGFTARGTDELCELATALNTMHNTLKEQELHEKQMRTDQEKLVLGMAHDLRTPLTGLMGYLEVCRQTEITSSEKITFYIDKAMDKAIQIRDLSDKLFEYFLSNNHQTCSLEPPASAKFLLGDYLSEMCAQLNHLHFTVTSTQLIWKDVNVEIDSDYLGRIVNNIVSNIEKYADLQKEVCISSLYTDNTIGIAIRNSIGSTSSNIQGNKIGVENISKMMLQMNGRCEVSHSKDTYQITLWFPTYLSDHR